MYLQPICSKQVLKFTPPHLISLHQMRRKCAFPNTDPLGFLTVVDVVLQQLFGQSLSASSFESMKQQAPYKSNEMSRFDMLLKSKLPRNHISILVSVVNALGLSVNISHLENPKDILPNSFFCLCTQNVAKLQHLDPVAAAPVLRKMFCRWLTTNCSNFTKVNIKILFTSLFF